VRTLVSGGAGSKHKNQNPTMLMGILGFEDGWGVHAQLCGGAGSNSTNPLGLVARTW